MHNAMVPLHWRSECSVGADGGKCSVKHAAPVFGLVVPVESPAPSCRCQCRTQCALKQVSYVSSSEGVGEGRKGWNGVGQGREVQGMGRLGAGAGWDQQHPGQIHKHGSTQTCASDLAGTSLSSFLASAGAFPRARGECPLTLRKPPACKIPQWGTVQDMLVPLYWHGGISIKLACPTLFDIKLQFAPSQACSAQSARV